MRETWVLLSRTDLHCITSHLKYMQVARILWIMQVQCFSHMTQCWFWEQTMQQFDLNLAIKMKALMKICQLGGLPWRWVIITECKERWCFQKHVLVILFMGGLPSGQKLIILIDSFSIDCGCVIIINSSLSQPMKQCMLLNDHCGLWITENCMKMKEIGWREVCVPSAPLDPPMHLEWKKVKPRVHPATLNLESG